MIHPPPPSKISMVTGGIGGIETVTMRSLHDALHAMVFQIKHMTTQDKGKHLSNDLHA